MSDSDDLRKLFGLRPRKPQFIEAVKDNTIKRLQSQLEAERAKVRVLQAALIQAKNRAINVFNTGDIDVADYEADLSISEIEQSLSNTSTAPTEAEIRAQRDREIADWLEKESYNFDDGEVLRMLANELRQRGDKP